MAFKESLYKQEGDWSQRKQRRGQMFKDQHGRVYHATIELKSMDPTGPVQPQYQAPLPVPQMYMERSTNPERPYDLVINYTRWEADVRAARGEWEREGRIQSRTLYGEKYDPTSDFTPQVLELIGPPPQYVEPIIAARQGNPWVLGLTKTPDRRLVQFFERDVFDPTYRKSQEPDYSTLDAITLDDETSTIGLDDDDAAALGDFDTALAQGITMEDAEFNRLAQLEEQYDPAATGGTRVPVKRNRKKASRKDPVPASAE